MECPCHPGTELRVVYLTGAVEVPEWLCGPCRLRAVQEVNGASYLVCPGCGTEYRLDGTRADEPQAVTPTELNFVEEEPLPIPPFEEPVAAALGEPGVELAEHNAGEAPVVEQPKPKAKSK